MAGAGLGSFAVKEVVNEYEREVTIDKGEKGVIEQELLYDFSEWLRVPEAAELVGYTPEWIRRLARAGRIQAIKVGREWLVHEVDLLEYHAAMRSGSKAGKGRASVGLSSPTKHEGSNRVAEQKLIVTIPDGWLTASEAAELTGCSGARVRQLARAGGIRAAKIGGEWVMHQDDLLARYTRRQTHCLWCGKELEHRSTGRPRKFCSGKCRVYYGRAERQYARTSAEAALRGAPQPPRDFGYPIELAPYAAGGDGDAMERHRLRIPIAGAIAPTTAEPADGSRAGDGVQRRDTSLLDDSGGKRIQDGIRLCVST